MTPYAAGSYALYALHFSAGTCPCDEDFASRIEVSSLWCAPSCGVSEAFASVPQVQPLMDACVGTSDRVFLYDRDGSRSSSSFSPKKMTSRYHRGMTEDIHLCDVLTTPDVDTAMVQGQSGSMYRISISDTQIRCGCPDHQCRRMICKHMCFLLFKELKLSTFQLFPLWWCGTGPLFEELASKCPNIRSLLRQTLKKKDVVVKIKPVSSEDVCPVCYDPFSPADAVAASAAAASVASTTDIAHCTRGCGAAFHKRCLDQWLNIKNECPLCRSKIFIRDLDCVEHV